MIPSWEIKILYASWCSQKRTHPNWEKQRNQKTRQKKVGVWGAAPAVSIVTFSVRWSLHQIWESLADRKARSSCVLCQRDILELEWVESKGGGLC